MTRIHVPLAAITLFALSLTPAATPAQEAAPRAENPVVLTAPELKLWHSWITADFKACYGHAQELLADPATEGALFYAALELQVRSARELNWTPALAADLAELAAARDGAPEFGAIRDHLAAQLTRAGKISEGSAAYRQLGFITDWWVAGPFPNDRGQGFEDVQEPQTNLDLDATYTGKDGHTVAWRKLPATPYGGVIDLGAMQRPAKEATSFLMAALWADEGVTSVRVGVASTNQVKLWVAGRTLDSQGKPVQAESPLGPPKIESDNERSLGLDHDEFDLSLTKGWNVIVVKSGVGEGEWKLRVRAPIEKSQSRQAIRTARIDAEMREALAGVNPTQDPMSVDPGEKIDRPSALHRAVVELLRPRLDRSSSMPRKDMDVALLMHTEKTGPAAEGAVLGYLAAWANVSSAGVAAGREENRRRELLLECLKLEPGAARAALELSQYYTRTFANPALADEYAQRAVKLRPDWVEARIHAAGVLAMKGMSSEIERELPKLLKQFPGHPGVLRQAGYYAGRREDYAASNALFEKALAADFTDSYSRDRLMERAVARGDVENATKYSVQRRQLNPFDTGSAGQLANLHVSRGEFEAASGALEAALHIAPRDDDLLAQSGELLAMWAAGESGEEKADLAARSLARFREALEANPRREDLVRYLEFQDRERPKFEALLQEDITERIKQALQSPREGDDPYEVIYRDEITVINDDGTKSFYTQEARRVLNDNGRDQLQSMSAPAWGGQQSRCVEARLHRASGGVEEGRRSAWGASFADLDIGDIVHVRFRVTDREQSFFGDFFGAIEVLADYVPVREMRLVYVFPPGREFHEYTTRGAPARIETTVEGRRAWTYTARDVPKLPDEVLAPEPHQRAATVQISTYKDWKDFGRWYYNLIRKQLEPTPEMTARVAELTANAKTEKDKVRAIYNWVVTEVRYNADWHFGVHGYKPFSAGAVFARCIGDCKDKAILICTMLGIAGVNAYPVIIKLESYRGEEDITLPMPHHFNHAIAYIEYADGGSQFLDGTATYNGMEELPGADAGASVIVVRPEGGTVMRVPLMRPDDNAWHDDVEAEFEGAALKLRVTRTAVGDAASSLRARFQREGERQRLLEQEWSERFAGAKVSEISAADLADLDTPPWLKFSVELPGALTVKDGEISFRLAPNPSELGRTAFGALGTRRTDLLLPAPNQVASTWRFKLPKDMQPAGLPQKFSAESPHGEAEITAALEGGVLVVKRRYAIHGGVVKPQGYGEWRRALLDFDKAESATITLKKGGER